MSVDPQKTYNELGITYANKSETGLHNAYYERPAIISLLPDLQGLTVIDAGCGAGALTKYLIVAGAKVIAFDISEKLISVAKTKMHADFRVHDMSAPLDFLSDKSVDIIVSSLALHYIDDWVPVFNEFYRVLNTTGLLIFSTNHPTAVINWANLNNYFEEQIIEETWNIAGKSHKIRYYHKTLSTHFNIFNATGFCVEQLHEPLPLPEGKQISEESYEILRTRPHFILYRLRKI